MNMKNIVQVSDHHIHSKCNWTVYDGFDAIFPKNVFVRGTQVIKDFDFVGVSGSGKNIVLLGA